MSAEGFSPTHRCTVKVSRGKDFGLVVVLVGEEVMLCEVCGVKIYKTRGGRYLAPWLFDECFEEIE